MIYVGLLLAVYTVKDTSARIPFVLFFDLFLVLVFPVCINQNLSFSVALAVCIVKDIVSRILLSHLVLFYVLH